MDGQVFNFLTPYQIAWINESAPVAGAEKSRRIGWTYADALRETLDRAGSNPTVRHNHWHSSADLTAAEEYIGYCADFARMVQAVNQVIEGEEEFVDEETGDVAKIHTKRIIFESGLKITAGSSNPKFFRSKGGSVGLDEFAFHPQGRELYKAAHATARFWGYPLRFWSTHNGPSSYFNALVTDARQGKFRAKIHRVTVIDAVEQGIVERIRMRRERLADVPAPDAKLRQEWLDTLRAECPDEDVWNEEYMCIPSCDASSLLSYELMRPCEVANLSLFDVTSAITGQCFAGFDVGRKKDLSVLWVVERVGDVFWTRILRTFDRVNFSAQEGAVNTLLANRSIKRMCIDSTGIGLQMSERLAERWGKYRVEAVNFSGPVKSELAMPLRRLFEDKLIRIPADDAVREDLHSIRKTVTTAGNVRLDADRSETDGHGDRFWALALAYHAADDSAAPLKRPQLNVPVTLGL